MGPGEHRPYPGRLHRHHDDKHEIRIIDYVDHAVPVLRRMYAKRIARTEPGYRAEALEHAAGAVRERELPLTSTA